MAGGRTLFAPIKTRGYLALVAAAAAALLLAPPSARCAGLAPDDPAVAGSLALWLRDADIDYDPGGGLWTDSSGRGNDAAAVGAVGAVTYAAPSLAPFPGGGFGPGQLDAVHFAGGVDDLLATGPLNGGDGLAALTIIAVYAVSDRQNLTRPVGFGSIAGTGDNPGNHFNLGSDPSVRKDNGSVTGHTAEVPLDELFIRSARMGPGGIDEWFNSGGAPARVLTGGAGFTTSTDRFYLGDLRCGATPVPGFGAATSRAEIDIVEVLVYTATLEDGQIVDLNTWLVAQLGGTPPPVVDAFTVTPGLIASGETATLSWSVGGAATVSIEPGVGDVGANGEAQVAPTTTTIYTLTASGEGGEVRAEVTLGVDVPFAEPLITEFLAANDDGLEDEDGDTSDWVEIHNPNAFPLDLGGYALTDDPARLDTWLIPAEVVLPEGGHFVIFASGKDRAAAGATLHTNFGLERRGEFLALVSPDGATVVSAFGDGEGGKGGFPAQFSDVSYGPDRTGTVRYLSPPTPGEPNRGGFDGRVADTRFSVDRGFYEAPVSVEITTATEGAQIIYTTDGRKPEPGTLLNPPTGTVYTGPVEVATTTVLRAAAFKAGFIPTDVDTQTYLFLGDVIRQPADPPGFPSSWGSRAADYAMDARVVDDPAYRDEIIDGLTSIRSLSIVVPQDEFFNNPRGIYANPRNDGRAWEREVSLEFLHPGEPERDVQAGAGIRIHGNGSRSPNGQPKHSFRVEFRGDYGPRRLRYRLFPGTRVDEFDSLILRGQNAHGWTRSSQIGNSVGTSEREQSQYIRDAFARDLMKAMGQTSGEATYVHLYINGLYWGLYNPVEYPRSYYGVAHFGGVEEDYDVINRRTTTTKILDGTFEAWDAMQALADSGLETREKLEAMASHINLDNLIDYMLMHQYMGSRDGPEVFNSNNMRAIRNTRGAAPTTWIGMPWDMEASMFETDVTRNVNVDDPNTLVRVYTRLRANPEFRLRYADRVHRHCFNGGALTPEETAATWEARAAEILTAIIGESARWGDYRRPSRPFTRDAEWQQERERLLTTYFPTRTAFLVDLLRGNDLYPDIEAPAFNPPGGEAPLADGSEIVITATAGTVYYTLDGTDPREAWTGEPRGTLYTESLRPDRSVTLRARALDGGEWSALNEATFLVGTLAAAGNVVVSELMYNPPGPGEDLEYLELANVADHPVDLTGARFGAGVDFVFPTGTVVPPGGFILVVADRGAFESVYGGGLPIAGEFQNGTSLDNAGERVELLAADGAPIESFRYNDRFPWPVSADDAGASLTRIIAPTSAGDAAAPASWRPSVAAGGSPGGSDAVAFVGDPWADADGDGLPALLEHATGGSDGGGAPRRAEIVAVEFHPPGEITVGLRRNLAADDVDLELEVSADLTTWAPADGALARGGTSDNGDGSATIRYSGPAPPGRHFWRARARLLAPPPAGAAR